MTTIETAPLTPERWDDVQRILAGGGDGASCQCVWPLLRGVDFERMDRTERGRAFRAEVDEGVPGLVAYVDGEPAGWVRIGPRDAQTRVRNRRGLAAVTRQPFDDERIWALSCFSIPRSHRGQGLMGVLLDAAVDRACAGGASAVEAYPAASGEGASSNDLFVGMLSVFLAAGFEDVAPLGSRRRVVQLAL